MEQVEYIPQTMADCLSSDDFFKEGYLGFATEA
jgi:hypothetical protein